MQSPLQQVAADNPSSGGIHSDHPPRSYDGGSCYLCNLLRSWVMDTSTMYRKGSIRLGVTIMVTGAAAVALGATLMILNNNHAWSGLGIWTGIPIVLSGIVCIVFRGHRPRSYVSPISSLCLVCALISLFLIATSCANLVAISVDPQFPYPTYTRDYSDIAPLNAINSVLLAVSVIQAVACIWVTVLSTGHVSKCCLSHRGGIFTISYDDPMEHTLSGDTDFTVESFDDVQHVLSIDSDWYGQVEGHPKF